jgi:hypothetical protein
VIVLAALHAAIGCGDGNNDDDGAGGPTPTPTPVPTATATAAPQIPCPTKLTYTVTGADSDLDAGTTGIYANQKVGDGGSLSFALACPGQFLGGCGACALSGPIQSTTVADNHRCLDASETTCTSDADCPGSSCVFFFGAPVPVSGGGFPICVSNRVSGSVTGTVSPETGSGVSDFDVVWEVFTGITNERPCPTCSGATFDATGVCQGGARDGESCTVHGTSALFGNTSFDCPANPAANIATLDVPFDLTTGTRELAPTATCTDGSFAGKACYCEDQAVANDCSDLICTVDANGEGTCAAGPVIQTCMIETFRGCTSNAQCTAAGDSCVVSPRPCQGATDATGATIAPLSRTGVASRATPLQVATFCIGATRSGAVNTAAGLPGPGALRLPTTVCIKDACP